jgi:hypothetical protein
MSLSGGPGIIKIPGAWDVAIIRQEDGLVILEAPISSGYSSKVIREAARLYPHSKIKAVITTSDAFPHFGGLRQYVAQGIPIYALDLNTPILGRLVAAPHSFHPDSLQSTFRKPQFKVVSGRTVLGKGASRLELIPFRTESGERMMMVYFPERRLLYASDLVQKSLKGGFFMPQYLSEVIQAVTRENISVENVFALHTDLTPWSELLSAVDLHVQGR